jgi:DNA-binding NtrC family response regulator
MKKSLLVVDDKEKVCHSLVRNFNQRGYHTLYATTRAEALRLFSSQAIDAVLLDVMLGEESGLDVLADLRHQNSIIPVIMMTGYGSIGSAVESMKLGAVDYVTKPLNFEKLLAIVEHVTLQSFSHAEHMVGDVAFPAPYIVTKNTRMIELCHKAERLAHTDLPILITGENGTGKEVLADFIHHHSARSQHTMLKINCAAFPETLLDNELFGHERGAYTGAEKDFRGVFERAHESSLFLDEIGDMPLTIQAKILRTLQHHEIRRIGGEHTIHIDVRFIAATNQGIDELLERKQFR